MRFKEKIKELINKTEDMLFPHYVCPFCEVETYNGEVCGECMKLVIEPKYCKKCGEHISEDTNICIQCKDYERFFDQNFSCYHYKDSVTHAIQKFKFSGAKYLSIDFAKIFAKRFADMNIDIDIVTFVPSTKRKIKSRGYNQAEEMAKEFAKLVNIPCLNLLVKTKETAEQKELSRKERLENLIDSIAVADKWQVKGKNILVIDDIFTTGATISACAKALKKAGATKVYALTLAKTEIKI